MIAVIAAKSARDRTTPVAVAVVTLALFLAFAMAVYRDIDLSIYTEMGEGIRSLMGIPDGADAASLSYNVLMGFLGALTMAGLAISMGAAAIAGEERDRTLGLLLANPTSRATVLVAKAAAMLVVLVTGTAALWLAGLAVPFVLDVDLGSTHVGALMAHMGAVVVFHGFLALAIGAWTGSRSKASGVATGVLVVSYVAVGLLPLVPSVSELARVFPWYYFDGSDPLVGGVDWGHLGLLAAGTGVLGGVALVGVNRRDLRSGGMGPSLLDRLRGHAGLQAVVGRVAGQSRVSAIWTKTASEHQAVLAVASLAMFAVMGVLIGVMYPTIEDSIGALAADMPDALLAIAGGGDMTTPEGFYTLETFSLMAPLAFITVTTTVAAKGLAGLEADGTAGILYANPVHRRRVVAEVALAMVVHAAVVGAATFAGVTAGSALGGLGMSVAGIAAATVLSVLLGLVFGAVALVAAAATGQVRIAVWATVGTALASHFANSFLPLSDRFAGWARLTPSYYQLAGDPLVDGMDWGHAAVLAAGAVLVVAAAVLAYDHRDLRQH